jgi:uncharacterized phage-like protein YoqJ
MRLIVAGSRNIQNYPLVKEEIDKMRNLFPSIRELVSGAARGVDSSAITYGIVHKILVTEYPALWEEFGKSAGKMRNELMAEYGDALLAIWDGESRGTKHMIDEMKKRGKPVYIVEVKNDE